MGKHNRAALFITIEELQKAQFEEAIEVSDIQKLIRKLTTGAIGVLITGHNACETLGIRERVYILNEGVILEEGLPENIASISKARNFYLGEGFRL